MSSESWTDRLLGGFRKTSDKLSGNLSGVVGTAKLDDATLDDVEDALILSDLGPTAAARIRARLAEQDLALELDDAALAWLADKGFDPVYGARPVKRAIQRALETPIARKIVGGAYPPGATVRVTAAAGELALS